MEANSWALKKKTLNWIWDNIGFISKERDNIINKHDELIIKYNNLNNEIIPNLNQELILNINNELNLAYSDNKNMKCALEKSVNKHDELQNELDKHAEIIQILNNNISEQQKENEEFQLILSETNKISVTTKTIICLWYKIKI